MKKLLAMLCMLTCVFGLTACGETALDAVTTDKATAASMISADFVVPYMLYAYYGGEGSEAAATAAFHQQHYNVHELEAVTEDNLNAALQMATGSYGYSYGVDSIDVDGNAILNGIVSFSGSYSGLGDVTLIDRQNISYKVSGDEIIVTVPVTGSVTDKKGNPKTAEIEVIFTNDIFLTLESCTLNIDQSIGELMGKAAMDTVMGMGTVFAILILISLIIWALGGIPKLQEKFSGKKKEAVQAAPAADSTAVQTVVEESGDDLELIAVIAAAIVASEGAAGTDGFVVRSIRKRR
ncbi:MAG: OadG family protein [Lachnospiraceae bacterium]|nr:OadG family protein [Lachnospiraceae bacterium]